MTDQIRAPWTPEQVAALNAFQLRGGMHPFTCGGEHTPGSPALIAYTDGWRCSQPYGESCDYRQDWAHAFMADPDAWPKPPFGERHGSTPEEVRAWTPPPPGVTREQVPAEILALLPERSYTSTACDTGYLLEADTYGGVRRWGRKLPDGVTLADLEAWIKRLHKRCRLNHKFTGRACSCQCHGEQPTGVVADCRTCRGHRVVPDWTTRNGHGEPKPKPCSDCQTAPTPDPAATEATEGGWQQQDDGTWTLSVDGGTVLFTRRSTPEERARFAEKWAERVKPAPAATAAAEGTEEQNLVHALGGDRTAETIAHTLTVHGHTLNAVRTMTYAELLAVPGIGGPSLARIRAALDGCLEPDDTDQTEPATITNPAWLREQYAAAVQPLLMDILPKQIAAARAWEIVDTILFVRDRHLAQLRQRLDLADADLGNWAAVDGEARTTPDNGAASGDAADNPLREQYAAAVECAIGLNVDCGGTEGVHRVRDAVLAVRDREMEQHAAAHIRDQAALAQIRLHIAAHRQRLWLADPVLLAKVDAVLREVGELETAGGGQQA